MTDGLLPAAPATGTEPGAAQAKTWSQYIATGATGDPKPMTVPDKPQPADIEVDLPPQHQWLFNAQADAARTTQNIDYYAQPSMAHLTVADMKALQDQQRQALTDAQARADALQKAYQDAMSAPRPVFDQASVDDAWNQANADAKAFPTLDRPQLNDPSPLGLAVSALMGAAMGPRYFFTAAAAPLAWGIQDQHTRQQLALHEYDQQVEHYKSQLGLDISHAQALATMKMQQFQLASQAHDAQIEQAFKLNLQGQGDNDEWRQTVYKAGQEWARFDALQKWQIITHMVTQLTDPTAPPAYQARAAAFLNANGLPLQAIDGMTPQQIRQVLENKMLSSQDREAIARARGQEIQNQWYPAEAAGRLAHLGAQTQLANAQAQNIPQMTELERQRVGLDAQRVGLESQRVGIEGRRQTYLENEGSRLVRTEWARLNSNIQANKKALRGTEEEAAEIRDKAFEAMKKDPQWKDQIWVKDRQGWGWSTDRGTSQEDIKKHNDEVLEKYLQQNARIPELKRQAEALQKSIDDDTAAMQKLKGAPELQGNESPGTPGVASANPVANGDLGARYQGVTKYQWGGTSDTATDCSGFTQNVYRDMGIRIPRTTQEQMASSIKLGAREVQPGDLVGFGPNKDGVRHIGIVVGIKSDPDGRLHFMVRHNSSGRGPVVEDLEKMYTYRNGQFNKGGGFFRPKAVIAAQQGTN